MIVRSLCNSCFQPYILLVQPSDVALVRDIADENGLTAPCPRLCGGRINLNGDQVIEAIQEGKKLAEPLTITGLELFKAVNGAGLPDEIAKDWDVLVSLFRSNKVVDVNIEEANGKFYLHEVKLERGITVHLGASPRGAIVVKVTKERADGAASHS